MRRFDRRQDDERGLLLVIFSVAMSVMLIFAALVLDLSQLRVDRRVNKSVADTAVRAGLSLLHLGPWSGVCRAREYLKTNSRFSDLEGEKWFQLGSPVSTLTSSPCLNTAGTPFKNVCLPGELDPVTGAYLPRMDTWGRLTAKAGGGRYSIEIQSGYTMPDPRFPEDVVSAADTGDMLKGACDNLVVVIKQTRPALFGGVVDRADKTTMIRSVGRISNVDTGDYNPALLLLERGGCAVLTTSGIGTKIVAQPYLDHPGVIQIDSADNQGGCTSNQAVLRGADSTTAGPSIVACSASLLSPSAGCNTATANKPGRIGIHALNFPRPASDYVTTPYSTNWGETTYGDVRAVPSAQSGRTLIDDPYRNRVVELDQNANSVINSNGTGGSKRPPGCSTVTNSRCTGTDGTWLVLNQTDCDSYDTFFTSALDPLRSASQRIWFDCNLTVKPLTLLSGLTLSALNSFVVITGTLTVTTTFAITDPRKVYIGGTAAGPGIGLDVGNGGNLNVGNPVAGANCPITPMVNYTRMVVGDGSFKMGSGAVAHLCGTFLLMASGYNKLPAKNGTEPCTCSTYKGSVDIGSGSQIDWSAPNLITIRRPTLIDRGTSPFEDVALWTEAGGANSRITGGGVSRMSGVYFLGNADAFTLAGGGGTNVLSAQFIARRMVVTGNSTVNLVINPLNSLPLLVYELVLVR